MAEARKELSNYSNIYADLSQSAYPERKENLSFPERLHNNEYEVDYSLPYVNEKGELKKDANGNPIYDEAMAATGKNVGDHGKVYLQPDPNGLLTNKKEGFNAYYVTDTPTLNANTKETYFVVRGTDVGKDFDLMNDWVKNNLAFTLRDEYIPQAQLAAKAMEAKMIEMTAKAPNAKMNLTAHSLGTFVILQAIANLPPQYLDKIGQVVLFNGPDTRNSINKMPKEAQENIAKLEAQGKITYYVNPLDVVSMLNRNQNGVNEIGNVYYMLPKSVTDSFDDNSGHEFGQFQINADGTIMVANRNDNPELFAAAADLSALIEKTREKINNSDYEINSLMYIYYDFKWSYEEIIEKAKKAIRNDIIKSLKTNIRTSSGAEKISLQEELAEQLAAKAEEIGIEYEQAVKKCMKEAEEWIDRISAETIKAAEAIGTHLSMAEIDWLTREIQKSNSWDSDREKETLEEAEEYRKNLEIFSYSIKKVSDNISVFDREVAPTIISGNPQYPAAAFKWGGD